jgi:hypothetical protein
MVGEPGIGSRLRMARQCYSRTVIGREDCMCRAAKTPIVPDVLLTSSDTAAEQRLAEREGTATPWG